MDLDLDSDLDVDLDVDVVGRSSPYVVDELHGLNFADSR